jgi:hypothetical protein
VTPCELLVLHKSDFLRLEKESPSIFGNFRVIMEKRLAENRRRAEAAAAAAAAAAQQWQQQNLCNEEEMVHNPLGLPKDAADEDIRRDGDGRAADGADADDSDSALLSQNAHSSMGPDASSVTPLAKTSNNIMNSNTSGASFDVGSADAADVGSSHHHGDASARQQPPDAPLSMPS